MKQMRFSRMKDEPIFRLWLILNSNLGSFDK